MSCRSPLLFLDSGIGGLSVLQAVQARLPHAPYVYVADNAAYPYGTKSDAEILAHVPELIARLVEKVQPQLVIIPCNTACTIALEAVRAAVALPVIGTVPAIKPAAKASTSRVIGVLGTKATVKQAYVDNLTATHAADCHVLRYGSAKLVDLAEAKLRGELISLAELEAELHGLLCQDRGDKIDQIVLACTHFPLLLDELRAIAPPHMAFVDGAEGIARRAATLLQELHWPDAPQAGTAMFTRDTPQITAYAPALYRYNLNTIEVF
jgi:glutamate racemase